MPLGDNPFSYGTPQYDQYNQIKNKVNTAESEAEGINLARFVTKWALGALLLLLLLIGGCMYGKPQYDLYKANTQKRERIAEARAEADAENYRAEAEVQRARREADRDRIRAGGIRDAQSTINESLTEEYLLYHYIEGLSDTNAQIIYVPSDQLPLNEAGRQPTPTTQPEG
jgi:hypothetical protein